MNSYLGRWQARASRSFAHMAVLLYLYIPTEHNRGEEVQPTALLTEEAAQVLMDDLYSAGLRPTEGKVSDRTLAAQTDHLKDLRSILDRVLPAALK